ncbi:Cerevisin [Dactylellina cionopaga]|nr:Cerevisin [Dactylellina cionopaga]
MKSIALISTSLLLSALPSTFAAPAASNGVNARWFKPDEQQTAKVENVVTAQDDDPSDDYVVILAEDEKRPWSTIFSEMGCNETDTKTFGSNIRAFTMNMKKSVGVSMFSLPNVASLDKNVKYKAAVMPPTARPQNMPRSLVKESLRLSALAKRQNGGKVFIEQSTAPWNLQRISSANAVDLNGRTDTDLTFKYRFDSASGSGVDVYMLDTGINVAHVDFVGRAKMIFSVDNTQDDVQGHGTHTAGTVGARTFGVAKNVNLLGVKVLQDDGSGSIAGIVQGVDKVITEHKKRLNDQDFQGSVISMSLGGDGLPQAMKNILKKATDAGVHVSVAAGNENQDACNTSPAGFSQEIPIISVGATDITDRRASFSNFGKCVDIHAPGVDIVSTFNKGTTSTTSLQGTSMACPAVSGMIADLLVLNPDLKIDPAGMKKLILSKAQNGVIRAAATVPDNGQILLNNGFPGSP